MTFSAQEMSPGRPIGGIRTLSPADKLALQKLISNEGVKSVAQKVGCSERTIYRVIKRGTISEHYWECLRSHLPRIELDDLIEFAKLTPSSDVLFLLLQDTIRTAIKINEAFLQAIEDGARYGEMRKRIWTILGTPFKCKALALPQIRGILVDAYWPPHLLSLMLQELYDSPKNCERAEEILLGAGITLEELMLLSRVLDTHPSKLLQFRKEMVESIAKADPHAELRVCLDEILKKLDMSLQDIL